MHFVAVMQWHEPEHSLIGVKYEGGVIGQEFHWLSTFATTD
jgi:hypothetical protein